MERVRPGRQLLPRPAQLHFRAQRLHAQGQLANLRTVKSKFCKNNCNLGCAAELEAAIVKSLRTSAPIFSCHTDGCSESRRPAYRHRGLPIRAVVSLLRTTKTKKNEENIFKKRKKCTILQRSKLILVNYQIAICVKFKRNVAKLCQILKFQPDYLLDRKKYCKTNIYGYTPVLAKSVTVTAENGPNVVEIVTEC